MLVSTPGPGGRTTSAVTSTETTGVFATGNPQVALDNFATTQSTSVSIEFGTDTTCDSAPQVVLQMEVSGQNAYRAVYLPSLYPGVQW